MKKLLIAATLSAAALAATPLFADPHQGHDSRGANAGQGQEQHAGMETRRAEMQKRMQERHARMASREHGQGRGTPGEHRGEHQNRGEGCPMQQAPNT